MKRTAVYLGLGLVALVLGMQLIPLNHTNPPVTREVKWDSPQTRALAQRACGDCHSNETVWPWDAYVAPASFLIVRHVDEGRSRLNFSEWDKPNSDYREVQRSINDGEMPLWDYLLVHPDANLTAAENTQLLTGLQATFQSDSPIVRAGRGGR